METLPRLPSQAKRGSGQAIHGRERRGHRSLEPSSSPFEFFAHFVVPSKISVTIGAIRGHSFSSIMARKKPDIRVKSYGIYHHWDSKSLEVPKIKEFTQSIPAVVGIEFGYVLEIKGARGMKIDFCIDHPPFPGSDGDIAPPFTGELHVRTTPYLFYLGDTLWDPIEDKVGPWRLTTQLDGVLVEDRTFHIAKCGLDNV